MTARDTGCLLGAACGLCQIRAEQAIASRAAYVALQREIGALLARDTRKGPRASLLRKGTCGGLPLTRGRAYYRR